MRNKRNNIIIFSSLILLATIAGLAQAQSAAPATEQVKAIDSSQEHAASTPSIETIPGPDGGIIKFIIDGKVVARLDAAGMHVAGNIEYGGTLTDSGDEALRRTLGKIGGHDE